MADVITLPLEKSSKVELQSCRMYESKYPEAESLVYVQVKNVADMGAYVSLLEYDNIEGMILLSELSRRRIRSIKKLIRVGGFEVVVVLRVDTEKGYIDLFKRRVSQEEIVKCEEKFNKSKQVHSIMMQTASTCKLQLIDLYTMFGWDLYKRFGHAYDAFKLAISEPEKVLEKYALSAEIRAALLRNVSRRMTPQAIKIRADIEVTCFSPEGIDAIKEALLAAEAKSTADMPIKIKLVAPPLYVMMTTALGKDEGISLLESACETISSIIRAKGGDMNIKAKARAVSEMDDKFLSQLMETLEKQNQEVDGDDLDDDK